MCCSTLYVDPLGGNIFEIITLEVGGILNGCAGKDFKRCLERLILSKLNSMDSVDLSGKLEDITAQLSTLSEVTVKISDTCSIDLKREEYERSCQYILASQLSAVSDIVELTQWTMAEKKNMGPLNVDFVMGVGGPCRAPMVKNLCDDIMTMLRNKGLADEDASVLIAPSESADLMAARGAAFAAKASSSLGLQPNVPKYEFVSNIRAPISMGVQSSVVEIFRGSKIDREVLQKVGKDPRAANEMWQYIKR